MKRILLPDISRYPNSLIIIISVFMVISLKTIAGDNLAFPGAMGWGAETVGGRGGQIIKVTTLDATGPGSFLEALNTPGPRIIVFEVGGVIDLGGELHYIVEPHLTIAGQTAPSPGITFIRGGFTIRTHDVIIQHVMIRPGLVGIPGGGINTYGQQGRRAHDVIVDHCSVTWGPGNHMSASGKYEGDSVEERRLNVAHRVTYSNNLLGEGLVENEGRGSLTHNYATRIAYLRNLYAKQRDRNPRTNVGVHAVIANNYVYNFTFRGMVLGGHSEPHNDLGRVTLIGNYGQQGISTIESGYGYRPLVTVNSNHNAYEVYESDNVFYDIDGNFAPGGIIEHTGSKDLTILEEKDIWHETIEVLPSEDLPSYIAINVGARPWDRDPIDQRIIDEAVNITGEAIIHQDQVGGYPDYEPTYQEFNPDEWDLDYMIPLNGYWLAPAVIFPGNNAVEVGNNPTFVWEDVVIFSHYTFQLATDEYFPSLVVDETDITETSFTVENLQGEESYYWRVRGHNATGPSNWSEVRQFNLQSESDTGSLDIQLNSGWNQISSNIVPVNRAIEDIFSDIQENLTLVKNDNTGIYWPEIEINEIGEWNPLLGYQVYVEDEDVLQFTGTRLSPDLHPVDLNEGWNQIAYLRTTPMNVEDALAGIDNEIEIVSNNAGDVYWPEYDINSLVIMEPGQGYKLSVTEEVTLTYPANDEGQPVQKIAGKLASQSSSKHRNRPSNYNVAFGNTGDFAILLLLSSDLADGDEVGVWSPSNDLVGSGVAQNGKALVTVWGRNPVMNDGQNIYGAVSGDMLRLTQWSTNEGREYPVTVMQVRDREHHQFANPLLRYQSDAVWIVDAEALSEIPRRYTLEQNYPNPFNPITTIRYGIPEPVRVRLEVYNTVGQRIKVLVDEEKQAGFHQVIFDANDLSSGVYFYRLQAGNYTMMKRAVLLR